MTALTLQRGFPLRCNGSMSAALERDIDLEHIAAHFTKSVPHMFFPYAVKSKTRI